MTATLQSFDSPSQVADDIVRRLNARGFDVWRYDGAAAIYLKPDDGALGTIRISNHTATADDSSTFNVLPYGSFRVVSREIGDMRRRVVYLSWNDTRRLVDEMCFRRRDLTRTIGEADSYKRFENACRRVGQANDRAFWDRAYKCPAAVPATI